MKMRHFLLVSMVCTLAACANNPHDPYEPYNRTMFKVNDALDTAILAPTARGYNKVVPKPVRSGVTNVFDNFKDVVSFGSNVLRLDVEKAATDFTRVGFNTVFGLGGLLPMADLAQMPNNKNTLGDTFASWGWKNSNYLVMPLAGPSTVRDTLGGAVATVYSPQGALISYNGVLAGVNVLGVVDTRAKYIGLTDTIKDAAPDKYAYTRDFYMRYRAKQTGGKYGLTDDEEVDIDDLMGDTENAPEQNTENPPETPETTEINGENVTE
ncbi:MAG: VacJ family lipoprotein [Neisseriaceae bacterium]|nr:VacJ family lipoprotein [Neisseriaceae bacterium]